MNQAITTKKAKTQLQFHILKTNKKPKEKKKNLIWQPELIKAALDPEEDGEEGTSDDERSRDWSIICNVTHQKNKKKQQIQIQLINISMLW